MKVAVLGCGQTGKMAASVLQESGHSIFGFFDDNAATHGISILGKTVVGAMDQVLAQDGVDAVCVGVGTIAARKALCHWIKSHDLPSISAIHPSAIFSPEVELGENLIIGANSTFYIDPKIGEGCFFGPSVTVSHDTVIGNYCLISVGSTIGARCNIGDEVLIGTGATLMPPAFSKDAQLNIGNNAIVGVGSTVIRDVAEATVVVGTPARQIERKN